MIFTTLYSTRYLSVEESKLVRSVFAELYQLSPGKEGDRAAQLGKYLYLVYEVLNRYFIPIFFVKSHMIWIFFCCRLNWRIT